METDQVARWRREIRALAKAAEWEPEALAKAVELQAELDDALKVAAQRLNTQGFSWREIGSALGITRTAAHKRYAASS